MSKHPQTLLYMLLQRAGTGTIPPRGFFPPPWKVLAETWDSLPQPQTQTVTLGPAEVVLGHDDNEADDDSTDVLGHSFGWDNEHPERTVHVDKFKIEWRPVTNGQFYEFYMGAGKDKVQFPKSWIEVDGEVFVSLIICASEETSGPKRMVFRSVRSTGPFPSRSRSNGPSLRPTTTCRPMRA